MSRAKKREMYKVLTAVAGVITCFCYLNYWVSSIVTNASVVTATLISLIVLSAVILPFVFRKRLQSRFPRAYNLLKWIYTAGMWSYVVGFSIFCVFIISYNSSPADVCKSYGEDDEMVIVTFGCKTYGMTPGKALRHRLDVTAELLEHFPNAVTIVSGGQGPDETNSEALAMQAYLVSKGISSDRVIMESASTDTIENLRNSLKIIDDRGLGDLPLIGVSHNYHAPRIKLLGERMGVTVDTAGYQTFDFAGVIREFMAYIKLFIFNRDLS